MPRWVSGCRQPARSACLGFCLSQFIETSAARQAMVATARWIRMPDMRIRWLFSAMSGARGKRRVS